MTLVDRTRLLEAFAGGAHSVRELFGLPPEDLQALARLGAAALAAKRWDAAKRVFEALRTLENDRHEHVLHLAYACAGANDVDGTREAVASIIDREYTPPADLARALLLRAQVLAAVDRSAAEQDLAAARALAEVSESARKVVLGGAA